MEDIIRHVILITEEDTQLPAYNAPHLNHPLGYQYLIKVLVICPDCPVQWRASPRLVRMLSYYVDDLPWWVEGLVGGEDDRASQGLRGDGGGLWNQVQVVLKVRNIAAA